MSRETPFCVNNLLLFFAELSTMMAFLFENNTMITQLCPNSLLYFTLPISIIVYFYVYNIKKINTNLIVNTLNIVLFFSCAVFTGIQVSFICNSKITNTWTYFASVCNTCVFSWFGCDGIKKVIEHYGVYTPIETSNETTYSSIQSV